LVKDKKILDILTNGGFMKYESKGFSEFKEKKVIRLTSSDSKKIEMFSGRPERTEIISNDEIVNLKVLMNSKVPSGFDPMFYFLSKI
jgi:hypothetical protein